MGRSSAGPRRDRNGLWFFVVDIGDGPDGRRRQVKRRGFKTRKAAQEALDQLRVDSRQGTYVAPRRQRLSEFLPEWLETIRSSIEPSTWASYERSLRLHVIPHIGAVQLQAVDPGILNGLYSALLESGRRDGKGGGLSNRTVRYVATILGSALGDAARWGRITRNPAPLADPPAAIKSRGPEMKTWEPATLATFLEREQDSRYRVAWLWLATTGTRRGEALGLRWVDVDLDAARAQIRQSLITIGHRPQLRSSTKSGRGRVIDLDASTVAALRSWRAEQAQEKLFVGPGYQDNGLVFCHPDGRMYHPDLFSREFDRRVARYGLPRIRLHDLRHTWATLALSAGVHPKVVSERLGHSSIAITLDTYSHVTPAMSSDAAERVAGLIFGRS